MARYGEEKTTVGNSIEKPLKSSAASLLEVCDVFQQDSTGAD